LQARRSAGWLLVLALAGLGAEVACGRSKEAREAPPAATGARRAAPEFRLQDLDGTEVQLADFRGKVVMVNFWATWCGPCRAEIPDFIELQRELGPRGLQIVGVSLDDKGAAVVRPFAAQQRINYVMLVNGHSAAGAYGGVSGIPTTFLVDRDGRIVTSRVGLASKQFWKDRVTALLGES
jgi:cytochrome c biogenesis protein CcmG/thiol:disulfide interchange protein DsbE